MTKLSMTEYLYQQRARLDERIAEAEEREALLEAFPTEAELLGYAEEPVIFFKKAFPNGAFPRRVYTYVAVYTTETQTWYTSGPKTPKDYAWYELKHFLSEGVDEIWIATEWEQVL